MLPPMTSPSDTGSKGCRCAGTAEEDEHGGNGEARQEDHGRRRVGEQAEGDARVLDVVDAERAERCDGIADRQPRRDDRLRQLVGDDRGAGDHGERGPLRKPGAEMALAPQRSAAVRSSMSPTRTSTRRGGLGPGRLAHAFSWQPLVVEAESCVRDGVEPLLRDRRRRRRRTVPYVPLSIRSERVVDLGDDVARRSPPATGRTRGRRDRWRGRRGAGRRQPY